MIREQKNKAIHYTSAVTGQGTDCITALSWWGTLGDWLISRWTGLRTDLSWFIINIDWLITLLSDENHVIQNFSWAHINSSVSSFVTKLLFDSQVAFKMFKFGLWSRKSFWTHKGTLHPAVSSEKIKTWMVFIRQQCYDNLRLWRSETHQDGTGVKMKDPPHTETGVWCLVECGPVWIRT